MSNPITGLGSSGDIGPVSRLSAFQPPEEVGGFGDVLSSAMQQVNQLSGAADQQIGSLLTGSHADMSSVMIAVEKADIAFQLMMQVRNKIVSAYQDVEKMQF